MKKVYVAMIADLVHSGHTKILNYAKKYGDVTVGLLTSEAIDELGDKAYLKYTQRLDVIQSLSMVSCVVSQKSASYHDNLVKLKPDYVIHGDDWIKGSQLKYRKEVIGLLDSWGGELIEIQYNHDIRDRNIKHQLMGLGVTTPVRLNRLKHLINSKKIIRVLEVHSALSALIAENTIIKRDNKLITFDAMWCSSLTSSTIKGKPDIEAVDITSRINLVNEIFEVSTKPMIFDADTGGKVEHFKLTVKSLERTGVSAVIIEDKIGLKKNSLLGNDVQQEQDSIANFCHKIKMGKLSQISDDFMIIARIESLILEAGIEDAIIRAKAYINAGADGIMIHSRHKDPTEIIDFTQKFRKINQTIPMVVAPTTFNSVTIGEFAQMGVNVVITANHMLRASYPAMLKVAKKILKNDRTLEVESDCMPINSILEFIPGTK